MNAFQLKEYWRYRRAAKGRHGVHSPAVYRFIEEALRPPDRHFKNPTAYRSDSGMLWQGSMLMRRIVYHFRFSEIIIPSSEGVSSDLFRAPHPIQEGMHEAFDKLNDWQAVNAEIQPELLKKRLGQFGGKDVIALHGIHQSAAKAEAWLALIAQPEVRLSIDLFSVGLLFFSDDFKERQHFVLKYPA